MMLDTAIEMDLDDRVRLKVERFGKHMRISTSYKMDTGERVPHGSFMLSPSQIKSFIEIVKDVQKEAALY